MCLIGFALDTTAASLLLASNRDEYFERPTQTAHWWQEDPDLFAGRDVQAGGTWLGLNQRGRLAALTNYRDGGPSTSRSRGELVTMALNKTQPVDGLIGELTECIDQFAGCSLLVFDWNEPGEKPGEAMRGWCLTNRGKRKVERIESGVFALSNGLFDENWPKSERLKRTISRVRDHPEHLSEQALLTTLTDHQIPEIGELPDSGIGEKREAELAPAFIRTSALGGAYGTRTSAIVRVDPNGNTRFDEWTWHADAQPAVESHRQMQIHVSAKPSVKPSTST